MKNIHEGKYPNMDEAVAFRVAFAPVICSYGSVGWDEIERCSCTTCGMYTQFSDFLAPKTACQKKDGAILDTYHYGVSIAIREELMRRFDIVEQDFRPVRNKVGDIVFYQLTPRHIMKPIAEVNRFRKLLPCRRCGSIQYREKEYTNKGGYPYRFITEEALADLCDLNRTFEEFEMHLPSWVVSKRVYEFFSEHYPRLQFQPMFLKNK